MMANLFCWLYSAASLTFTWMNGVEVGWFSTGQLSLCWQYTCTCICIHIALCGPNTRAGHLKRVNIRAIKGHLSHCPLPLDLGHVRIPDLIHIVSATRVTISWRGLKGSLGYWSEFFMHNAHLSIQFWLKGKNH